MLGEITDTNSVYLAKQFRDIGVSVRYITSVGDVQADIVNSIHCALKRSHIVITCGGLGPTVDDLTRQCVAEALDCELIFVQELYDSIAQRFEKMGSSMTENNRQQAFIPALANPIHNPVGTAPAFEFHDQDHLLVCLPGVPREMKYLFENNVRDIVRQQFNLGWIISRILRVAGIGESALDDLLGRELLECENPVIGLAAHHGDIDIRMTAAADTQTEANLLLDQMESRIRERVNRYIFGYGEDNLLDIVIQKVLAGKLKIHILEAGLSQFGRYFAETVQDLELETYAHPDLYGDADETIVDKSVSFVNQFNSEHEIAIAILSDPAINEGDDAEPRTAIAIAFSGVIRSRSYGFGAKSDVAIDWISRWSLASIWRLMMDKEQDSV
ncbi:hypothetical protein MASR2M15_02630 [Anaerolineales bacterium]